MAHNLFFVLLFSYLISVLGHDVSDIVIEKNDICSRQQNMGFVDGHFNGTKFMTSCNDNHCKLHIRFNLGGNNFTIERVLDDSEYQKAYVENCNPYDAIGTCVYCPFCYPSDTTSFDIQSIKNMAHSLYYDRQKKPVLLSVGDGALQEYELIYHRFPFTIGSENFVIEIDNKQYKIYAEKYDILYHVDSQTKKVNVYGMWKSGSIWPRLNVDYFIIDNDQPCIARRVKLQPYELQMGIIGDPDTFLERLTKDEGNVSFYDVLYFELQ